MPRRFEYSQHFIRDPIIVARLLGHSDIKKNDTVYDLGAGSGIIASVLSKKAARVIAVEIEASSLSLLRQNMAVNSNVEIIEKDILTLDQPKGDYKIFSNIPFSISAEIVKKFTELDNPLKSLYLIAQKQFARKLVPGNDHFTSLLSAQVGMKFTVRIRTPLKRTDFTPPPAVDTCLLEIKLRDNPLIEDRKLGKYRDFVEKSFSRQKFYQTVDKVKAGISPQKTPHNSRSKSG